MLKFDLEVGGKNIWNLKSSSPLKFYNLNLLYDFDEFSYETSSYE